MFNMRLWLVFIHAIFAMRPESELAAEQALHFSQREEAGAWDVRGIIETSVLEYILADSVMVDEDSSGFPGSVNIRLCLNLGLCQSHESLKDSAVFGLKTFELKYNGGRWKEELPELLGDHDLHDFMIDGTPVKITEEIERRRLKQWPGYSPIKEDVTATGVDHDEVENGLVPEERFPLTFTPWGRPAFQLKCETTVAHEGVIRIAMADLKVCVALNVAKLDGTSRVPRISDSEFVTRLKIPYARLGLSLAEGTPADFLNQEDVRKWTDSPVSGWSNIWGSCAASVGSLLSRANVEKFEAWLKHSEWKLLSTPLMTGHDEAFVPHIAARSHGLQVLAGPALMACAFGLQMLKKKCSGEHKSELWARIWNFISQAEARDKSGRIVQYGCRMLQGIIEHFPQSFPLAPFKKEIAEVQTTLAWARRTHRWGKEMPHIPVLGQAISSGDVLEAAQRAVLITFLIQDHVYWLLKVGILKFQNYSAIQWHRRNLRFITLSHVLNFSLCVREVMRIRQKQEKQDPKYSGSKEALAKAESEIYDNRRMMVRYVLTFIQMLHVSQVMQLDDWYIGLFGMISSYIDASKLW
mmetsp:Transcript_68348/g.120652  ORF Transcript_68348/g.120652 Transcript_68348/m.120652 type:complete len:581 (+) Transcript_68348:110-1852(+)